MQIRRRSTAVELALAAAALAAFAVVELAGASGGIALALIAAELLAWAGVAVAVLRSGGLGRLRKRGDA